MAWDYFTEMMKRAFGPSYVEGQIPPLPGQAPIGGSPPTGIGIQPPPTGPVFPGMTTQNSPDALAAAQASPAPFGLDALVKPYGDLKYDKPASPFQADINATLDMMQGIDRRVFGGTAAAAGSAVRDAYNYFGYDAPQWSKEAEQAYLAGEQGANTGEPDPFYKVLAGLKGPGGGYSGGGVTNIPLGEAYPDLGPLPDRQVAPPLDYGPVMEAFSKSAPQRQDRSAWGPVLEGLAYGMHNDRSDNIGEFLLNLGSSFAGGVGDYRQQQERDESQFNKEQQDYQARLAELELGKAEVGRNYQQSVMDTDFQNKMAGREEAVRKWQASQPEVLSASGGTLAYTVVGPDGKKMLTMDTRPAFELAQARAMAKSFGGGNSIDDFPYGSDDPGDYASWAAGILAEQPGLAEQMFADDPESLQDIQSQAFAESSQLAFGDKAQNAVLQQLLHSKIAAYLMQNPDKAKQIIMQFGLQ